MTRTILAIDPGEKSSGWVICDGLNVIDYGHDKNEQMIDSIPEKIYELMLIEEITYGMRVGRQIMRTVFWSGAFACAALQRQKVVRLLPRSTVKKTLCRGVCRPKDADVSRAVRARYPKSGGGARPEVGTLRQPGPLFGITDHCWQALALIHTWRISRLGEELKIFQE
jgi:hypothetical protein